MRNPFLSENLATKDGLVLYRTHHLHAVLLAALADRQYIPPSAFFSRLQYEINNEIQWASTIPDISQALLFLGQIGMVQAREDQHVAITDLGMEALRDGRFHQLASAAYFNYRTMKNNQLLMICSVTSLLIAVLALIVSVFKP